jgi:hypothetical protein
MFALRIFHSFPRGFQDSRRRGLVFLIDTARDDLEDVIGQRPLQCFASSHGARIQKSRSSSVVRITGIALGWIVGWCA